MNEALSGNQFGLLLRPACSFLLENSPSKSLTFNLIKLSSSIASSLYDLESWSYRIFILQTEIQ